MQLHFSPSMRSITISNGGNGNGGGGDLMKIKVAPRHISFRALFHAILILAFLLPFVFILTAVITLEGVNKCSSFGNWLEFTSIFYNYLCISCHSTFFMIVLSLREGIEEFFLNF